ncbi:MAG: CDP-alcohol phosphatidyltransferase family protein [Myxococcales bacterium]|nr:CDP-alcohol phosphatidyltransferase family protein [Myxococcales bacterium]HRC56755.1 CDP-alcohol phosphatidyltransferase family protein [Kofleriaceae bacterium]
MNLFAIRKNVDKVLHPVVHALALLPLHANTWTLVGAMIGLAGGAVFYYGMWWAGFALLLIRGLVDHVDGYKARNFGQRSTFGAVMDDVADRWVLGVMYAGGCIHLAKDYPHVLIVLGIGLSGALTNVIIKLSIYAESQQDVFRDNGKIGHPVDVVGLFGSAEFIIYYGAGAFFTALLGDGRPMLVGCWAVAVLSHVSLLQRVVFAWRRYRFVDPGAAAKALEDEAATKDAGAPSAAAPQASSGT